MSGLFMRRARAVAVAITCDEIPKGDWSPDNAGYLFIAEASGLFVEELTK